MKELAHSPLELYEKAYRLQYEENNIPEACRIYKALTDEFPDSNECGYAVVQLEKILATTVSERINVASHSNTILSVVAIAISIACLAVLFIGGSIYVKVIDTEIANLSSLRSNLSKALSTLDAARAKIEERRPVAKAVEEEKITTDIMPLQATEEEPIKEKADRQAKETKLKPKEKQESVKRGHN
jgi:chorismate mutase